MQRHLLHSVLVGLLFMGWSACASVPNGDHAYGPYGTDEVLIQVKNFNWSDVTIYMLRGGVRTRLGMVTSMGEALFRLPGTMFAASSDVRLILDPIGSPLAFTTEPIYVRPGQMVQMNVENYLPLTNWAVW